jgi:hypothetical protein
MGRALPFSFEQFLARWFTARRRQASAATGSGFLKTSFCCAHTSLHTAGQGAGQPASLVPAARAVTETGAAVLASGGPRKPRRGICRTRALRRGPDSGSIALIRQLIVNTNLAALAHRHGRSLLAKLDAALRWFEGGPVEAGRLRSALGIDPTEVRLTVRRLFPLPRTVRPHKNRDDPGKYEIGIRGAHELDRYADADHRQEIAKMILMGMRLLIKEAF